MPRIVIVGAGISGLAVAWRLRSRLPHAQVSVLEANPRPGGNIWTETDAGFRLELGPNGFLDSKPSTRQLCTELGLAEQLVAASEGSRKNRYLYWNQRLHALPASPLGIVRTPLLSPAGKLRLLMEPFRPRPPRLPTDESVAAFARRRFGREVAETFIDALVTGIHGGDPEHLSVAAAFPRLPKFEQEQGSVVRGFLQAARERRRAAQAAGQPPPGPQRMWSFRAGLRVLIETLAARLPLQVGVPIERLERTAHGWRVHGAGEVWPADAVVLTCPAPVQARLLAPIDEPLAERIATIGYTPIAVVAFGYRREHVPGQLDGFGYIAPQRTRRDVLGVQWCSSIFPDRAPEGLVLWRLLCGGVNRPDVLTWDDETLRRQAHREMVVTLRVSGPPVWHRIVRWPQAIPQYTLGHLERVREITARVANHPGLFVGGNAYHGIAINDCTEQAEPLANKVANYFADR